MRYHLIRDCYYFHEASRPRGLVLEARTRTVRMPLTDRDLSCMPHMASPYPCGMEYLF